MKHSVEVMDHGDLHDLVVAAEQGSEVALTRGGKIVARLVKAEQGPDATQAHEAIDRILEIGSRQTLGPDLTIRSLIEEGRKY